MLRSTVSHSLYLALVHAGLSPVSDASEKGPAHAQFWCDLYEVQCNRAENQEDTSQPYEAIAWALLAAAVAVRKSAGLPLPNLQAIRRPDLGWRAYTAEGAFRSLLRKAEGDLVLEIGKFHQGLEAR